MRKTSDLVNEMLAEAKNAWLVAIVVGFEQETRFVFSSRKTAAGRTEPAGAERRVSHRAAAV